MPWSGCFFVEPGVRGSVGDSNRAFPGAGLGLALSRRLARAATGDVVAYDALGTHGGPNTHDGQTYDLTGRESFTLAEAAQEMSRLTGKPIVFRDETLEEAYASRASYGVPDWEVEGWVTSYLAIAVGELAAVSDDVRRLTGHEPTTLHDYVSAYPECLAHVVARG
jgi:uncharacterized protein YbjT (DUF2867 family)